MYDNTPEDQLELAMHDGIKCVVLRDGIAPDNCEAYEGPDGSYLVPLDQYREWAWTIDDYR